MQFLQSVFQTGDITDGAEIIISLCAITAPTALQLQLTNQHYAEHYPNWTMPLRRCPMFSFCQIAFDSPFLRSGTCKSRRPAINTSADALAQLLTYEAVEKMIATGAITTSLVQE